MPITTLAQLPSTTKRHSPPVADNKFDMVQFRESLKGVTSSILPGNNVGPTQDPQTVKKPRLDLGHVLGTKPTVLVERKLRPEYQQQQHQTSQQPLTMVMDTTPLTIADTMNGDTTKTSTTEETTKTSTNTNQHYFVEYRCRAIRAACGLFDHYFIVVDNYEIHWGSYKLGRILPDGTTKNSHLIARKRVCVECYNKLMTTIKSHDDKRLNQYYPLLNCETLTMGFSIQALIVTVSLFVIGILVMRFQILLAIILFLLAILSLLLYSKYLYSRTKHLTCKHINPITHNAEGQSVI